jgi:hypothetical protein
MIGHMALTLSTRIVRSPDLVHTELEQHTMMMSIEAGRYFSLNSSGSRIWQLIEQPAAVADIVSTLEREFEVEPERCQAETMRLVENLLARDLARIVD